MQGHILDMDKKPNLDQNMSRLFGKYRRKRLSQTIQAPVTVNKLPF
jgi:hypothetical protein